jgi:hypothetical protein
MEWNREAISTAPNYTEIGASLWTPFNDNTSIVKTQGFENPSVVLFHRYQGSGDSLRQ